MPTVKARGDEIATAEPDDTQLIQSDDGAALATDVYLPPRGTRTSFPALLLRTPYGRSGAIDRVVELTAYFREAGFAVVVQDVRGRYESPGALSPFRHEFADGRVTLEWVAAQSWSNGEVFPFGDSYAGFTAWATASTGHPSVRGAVVRVSTPEIARHWMYRQGVFRLQMNAEWAGFAWGGPTTNEARLDWSARPLRDIDFGGADMTALLTWLAAGPDELEWQRLVGEVASRWRATRVPVLHWGGWWDLMARGQISAWQSLRAAGAQGQRLLMSASDHSFNRFPPTGGGMTMESQYDEVVEFLLAVTRGSVESTARWELANADWSDSQTWPPTSETSRLYLVDAASALFGPEGGALSSRPESVASTLVWQHNPNELVPSLETFVWATLANDYPDEREAHVRDDVVTFSADSVTALLDIVGNVGLHLDLEASSDVAQVVATLSDVRPDGTAWRICEGATRVAGGGAPVVVDLGPLAYRVNPGHRLRIALAASSFPRYMWACDDLVRGWNAVGGEEHELSLRVGVDSYLELPLSQKGTGS